MEYSYFISQLDKKLKKYFNKYQEHIYCQKGCTLCCEKGDYPMSLIEYKYMIQGYSLIENNLKIKVQQNIKNMKRGEKCPFLINNLCAIYNWRPIICRVHGLAYLYKENIVKIPYCANNGKNFYSVYQNGQIEINPITENLDTPAILKNIECGEYKNLYDWIKT